MKESVVEPLVVQEEWAIDSMAFKSTNTLAHSHSTLNGHVRRDRARPHMTIKFLLHSIHITCSPKRGWEFHDAITIVLATNLNYLYHLPYSFNQLS